MKDALLTLTALACLTGTSLAKGTADLPKEVQALHGMVGTWHAKNVAMTMDGKKRKGEVAMTCTAVSGGFAVTCATKITIDGLGAFEETDLFGYDPQARVYHWFAVTSTGETHDHIAMPPGDKESAMVFAHSGFQGTKPMQEVLRLGFTADGSKIDFRNDGVVAGQSAWTIVATFVKK